MTSHSTSVGSQSDQIFVSDLQVERYQNSENEENLTFVAKEFAKSTTFHGLSEVSKPGFWSKCFWSVIIAIVAVQLIFQITTLVLYFLSNPTSTNMKVVQPGDGLQFPSLTICTLQKFNKTRLNLAYPSMSKILTEFTSSTFFSAYSTALMDIKYFQKNNYSLYTLQKLLNTTLGSENVRDFVENVSFACRGQFLLCWFENGNIFDCCDEQNSVHFFKRFFIHSGPCFEIEFGQINRQRLAGPVGGFGFVFWYPLDDLFATAYNSYDEDGVHIYTSPTEAMLEKNPVVLPVGTHARMSLQAVNTVRLTKDQLGRQTCAEKSLKYFANYSYAACQVECLMDKLLEECHCIGINTYGHFPHRICTPLEASKCFNRLVPQFPSLLANCRLMNCSEPCSYWTYKVSLSAGNVFNHVNQEEMMAGWRLPAKGDPRSSLIIADVYFSDIEYLEITEVTSMTFVSFVSNIGGAMGLWTGASIVTWIHLIYFCVVFCHKKMKQRGSG